MFANLIESQSHGKEFKRRGRFILATAVAYSVLFVAAGIASVLAYDARVEAQSDDLEVQYWVPPVKPITETPHDVQHIRRTPASTAPIDQTARRPERTEFVSRLDDPTHVPDIIGTMASPVPPITPGSVLSNRNVDPPTVVPTNSGCIICNDTRPVVFETTPPPIPTPVKPQIQRVTSQMLISKVISLPQPPYPPMAKQIGVHGAVPVQILIDEGGKVISAQAVSGHPLLTTAAKDAAMRARFTPTILNGQPVKVQGVITYNFVLQ